MVPGCGKDVVAEQGWRDIDPCSLVDAAQVEALSFNSSGDVTAPQRVDRTKTAAADTDSIGCRWGDYVTVSLIDRNYGSGSPVSRMEPGMLPSVRTMDVGGKSAVVTEEKGGICNASVFYSDARLSVTIAPATFQADGRVGRHFDCQLRCSAALDQVDSRSSETVLIGGGVRRLPLEEPPSRATSGGRGRLRLPRSCWCRCSRGRRWTRGGRRLGGRRCRCGRRSRRRAWRGRGR